MILFWVNVSICPEFFKMSPFEVMDRYYGVYIPMFLILWIMRNEDIKRSA